MATKKPSTLIARYGPVRIYARGSRFRVAWFHGRQYERSAPTEAEARRIAQEIAAGTAVASLSSPDASFGTLVARAIDPAQFPQWGKNHAESMAGAARNHVIPELGGLTCRDVDRAAVGVFLSKMASAGYSKSSIKKCLTVIDLTVREGRRLGIYTEQTNPLDNVRMPAAKGKDEALTVIDDAEVPTDLQVARLIEEMDREGEMYGLMARVAAWTGIRWGELLALTPEDINLKTRKIRIRRQWREEKGKFVLAPPKTTKSARTVIIARDLVEPLQAYMKDLAPDQFLFTTSKGTPISRSNWGSREKVTANYYKSASPYRRAHDAAGWPDSLTWHSLRHYCATRWVREGVDIADVSTLLGHADTSITFRVYVGTDGGAADRLLERF